MQARDGFEDFRRIVLQARPRDVSSEAAHQRSLDGAVIARPDLVGLDRLARPDQFVAGGNHRHAGRLRGAHAGAARAGQYRHLRRSDPLPAAQDRAPGGPVRSPRVNELAPGHRGRRLHHRLVPLDHYPLDGNDGVGPARQHGAGHDLDAFRGRGNGHRRCAGALGARYPVAAAARLPCAMVDGDAVHGDPVEGGLVAFGVDGLAQHGPGAVLQRRFPGGQPAHPLQNQGLRLGDFGHGAPPGSRVRKSPAAPETRLSPQAAN